MRCRLMSVVLFLLICVPAAFADIMTIDFEGVVDLTPITNQYAGLVFSNATVISAGVSLNEFEFPPHSGINVAFDDGGMMSISFLTPVLNFSAFFTYTQPLTLTANDALNNVVASVSSQFANNLALSGDAGSSANELLSLNFAGGISEITIAGGPGGGSFTVDDITVETSDTTSTVPEVSSLTLLATVATLLPLIRKISFKGRRPRRC
jgi:hypothetical protein